MPSTSQSFRNKIQFYYQRLENRNLLAGDVSVAIDGSTLVISGDELSNQIDVQQIDSGEVVFTGRDSTTVNGLREFTFTGSFDRTRFDLGTGDDEVTIDEFEAGRELRFLGGDGNDRLEGTAVTARFFHIQGNDGDDSIQFDQSASRRSSHFFLGEGDDVVAIDSFGSARNFRVFGNSGNDTFTSRTLTVERKYRLNLGSGNDQALIAGQTEIGSSAKIRLGSGDDFLGVQPDLDGANANFQRTTLVNTGSGDDAIAVGASSQFDRRARFIGQSGTDSIDLDEAGFENRSIVRRFESQSVDNINELIDQVFERLDAVGFDSTQFGNQTQPVQSSLQIELADTEVLFTENGPAVLVLSDLELQAAPNENIVSATIGLQGGDLAGDVLTFEDQNGITGSFAPQTSTLTLTGSASASQYQDAIESILFENPGDDPLAGTRSLVISVQSELAVAPVTAGRSIQVSVVDDPLDLTLPGIFGGDAAVVQAADQSFGFIVEDPDPDNSVVLELDLEESGISTDTSQPSINAQTGEFLFTPSETGTFLVRVIATNDLGETDQEEFTLSVESEVDFAIVEIEDQTLNFNESLELPVQATQVNLESPLEFELEVSGDAIDRTNNLPVISETGVITWTPDLLTSGTATFTVTATDGNQVTAVESFEVTLPGFEPFQGNRQLASVAPLDRNGIYGDSFDGSVPPITIDQSLDYTATISTAVGDIVVSLLDDQTPISVNSFVNLAEDGFYDGLSFHRVVESPVVDENGLPVLDESGNLQFERFVAQAGDPTNTSTGGPGFRINDEILPELTFDRPGILAYARTNAPNSNGGQFFITYDATEFQNDEDFTIFGEVDNPATPTIIDSITITAS